MKTLSKTLAAGIAASFIASGAMALNMTIYDGQGSMGSGVGGEDNEVDASTYGQEWDLEAALLVDGTLWLVGGWNFVDGLIGLDSGDIFLDTNGGFVNAPVFPNPETGFEVAIDVDWAGGTYGVYLIQPTDIITGMSASWAHHADSGPFTFTPGPGANWLYGGDFQTMQHDGEDVGPLGYSFLGDLRDDTGVFSALHYYVGFDVASLADWDLTMRGGHFTMECGNDDLDWRVTDGGSVIALLGLALIGIEGFRRKSRG